MCYENFDDDIVQEKNLQDILWDFKEKKTKHFVCLILDFLYIYYV